MKVKQILNRALYGALYGTWYLLSLLPMWVHYALADVLYVLVAHVLRYRRRVIDKNLLASFPELSDEERRRIKHGYYHFFCDYIAETVKFATMSRENIHRRMVFNGVDQVIDILKSGQSVALMLGHYGNWEMVTAIREPMGDLDCGYGHIYHPLENEVMDRLFLTVRNRMGSESIPMRETLRWLLHHQQEGRPTLVGYISDQVPTWQNIHHWVTFFNQETPVFTGVERIARKMNQAVVYVDMRRVSRGHYEADLQLITREPNSLPAMAITDEYYRRMEATIRRAPQYWLWSHNRWKRTREEFDRRFEVKNGRVVERKCTSQN